MDSFEDLPELSPLSYSDMHQESSDSLYDVPDFEPQLKNHKYENLTPKNNELEVSCASGNIIPIAFPYRPYPSQRKYMQTIVQTLDDAFNTRTQKNAILESPTGTGKSLCLLCSLLGWHASRKAQKKAIVRQIEEERQATQSNSPRIPAKPNRQVSLFEALKQRKPTVSKPRDFPQGQLILEEKPAKSSPNQVRVGLSQSDNHFVLTQPALNRLPEQSDCFKRNTNTANNNNNTSVFNTNTFNNRISVGNSNNTSIFNDHSANVIHNNDTKIFNSGVINSTNDFNNSVFASNQNSQFSDVNSSLNYHSVFNDDSYEAPPDSLDLEAKQMINEFAQMFNISENIAYYHLYENNWEWEIAAQSFLLDSSQRLDSQSSSSQTYPQRSNSQSSNSSQTSNINWIRSSSDPEHHLSKKLKTESSDTQSLDRHFSQILPQIWILTRTHSQITQLISELRKSIYSPKMAVLASRDKTCLHHHVSQSANKNDDCMKVTKCQWKQNMHNIKLSQIFDLEDLVSAGKKAKGCPYYRARHEAENAELIFAPYNYLLDPLIRDHLQVDLQNSIIVIDEAHNIENQCRESYTLSFFIEEVSQMMIELSNFLKRIDSELIEPPLLRKRKEAQLLRDALQKIKSQLLTGFSMKPYSSGGSEVVWGPTKIEEFLVVTGLAASYNSLRRNLYALLVAYNDTPDRTFNFSSRTVHLMEWFFIIFAPMLNSDQNTKNYNFIFVQTNDKINRYQVEFMCLNPAVGFKDLKDACQSIILTSGTLSPMESFKAELQCNFQYELSCNHAVDIDKQLYVSVLQSDQGETLLSSYGSVQMPAYQDAIGRSLFEVCTAVPYGVLAFFTSFSTLQTVRARWVQTGALAKLAAVKKIFFEEQEGDFYSQLNKYRKSLNSMKQKGIVLNNPEIQNGALLLAVFRGKISEGLDFKDDICRAVISFGIPNAPIKDIHIVLKKKFNDTRKGRDFISGETWYRLSAQRALNQAIGRGLRHVQDFTSIIFMDTRFSNKSTVMGLSKWIQPQLLGKKSNVFTDRRPLAQSLRRFFSRFYNEYGQDLEWWEPYRAEKFNLLLCARELEPECLFFKDYFPRDLFKVICLLCRLL